MNRAAILALLLGLALTGIPQVAAQESETATVHLVVETHLGATAGLDPATASPLSGHAVCDVTVPAGADGTVVLDQAAADGCISGWEGQATTFGTYVVAIDDLRADGFTCLLFAAGVCDFWEQHVNGPSTPYGIDDYSAQVGDQVRWVYQNTL